MSAEETANNNGRAGKNEQPLYLVFLGVQSFRQPQARAPDADRPRARRSRSAYWQGLWNNLLNPKDSLFYLGVFTQLITPDMSIPQTMLLVTVMMTVSAFGAACPICSSSSIPPMRGILRSLMTRS